MELIIILLILMTQINGKNGTPALDVSKLTPLISAFGKKPLSDIPILKDLNLGSILPENTNLSDLMSAVSAFSSFAAPAGQEQVQPEKAAPANNMPPLRPISKIADSNITHALNQYFSE